MNGRSVVLANKVRSPARTSGRQAPWRTLAGRKAYFLDKIESVVVLTALVDQRQHFVEEIILSHVRDAQFLGEHQSFHKGQRQFPH